MERSRFAPDRGLTSRMLVTMFLLGLLYVVFVGFFVVFVPRLWVVVLVIAVALLLAQYFFSDRLALFAMHGRIVSPAEAPELHGVIDRICAMSDMPKPRVAVADTDVPNAFATGRNQHNAVVCVTTGLLRRLDPVELEGVLAHELSHVAHKDVAVMTIASFLGILAGLMLAFVISLDDVVITEFVKSGGQDTLPTYMLGQIRRGITPEINAISTAFLLLSILIVTLFFFVSRKRD